MKGLKQIIFFTITSLLIIFVMTLQGCSSEKEVSFHTGSRHENIPKEEDSWKREMNRMIIPIKEDQEDFYKAVGWLEDDCILYLANKGNSSLLYKYFLGTGEKKLLYQSDQPILSVEIGPGGDSFLLLETDSGLAVLTVLDQTGRQLFTTKIDSFEVELEWNPFDPSEIIVSTFTEGWDFTVSMLDIEQNSLEEIDLPSPFVHWQTKNIVVYQSWDSEGLSLKAPLYAYNILEKKTKFILPSVYQFDTIGNYILALNILEDRNERMEYSFISTEEETLWSFPVPALTVYSGWVIPFYDQTINNGEFLYLSPLHSGEADIYVSGFDLMAFDIDSKKQAILFSGLANEPISCSPKATRCLYGYQFEKIIDIEKKEIIELVRES